MRDSSDRRDSGADFAPIADARTSSEELAASCPALTASALESLPHTKRMPALFLGHGSPMNAIEDNEFTRSLKQLALDLPRPSAVLVVSAHWLTPGETRVLCVENPRTIHDFWGFPPELYEVEYPATGAPAVAEWSAALAGAVADAEWGLDHASWTLLRHMYPEADVPVLELSLDLAAPPSAHIEMGRSLDPLRERGVLILGSGNLVHNLRAIDWSLEHEGFDWAIEFDEWAGARIEAGDVDALADYASLGRIAQLSVPTNDHYLPLLYPMALRHEDEAISFTYQGMQMGAISMRGVRIG